MIGPERLGWATLLTLSIWGCDPPSTDDVPGDTRSTSDTVAPQSLTIASAPTVTIGTEDDGFPLNNVSGALRLSDGRIVVADGGLNSRLSVFDRRGGYLGQLGRSGEGPGEYAWVSSIQLGPEDSVFVYDASLQRLSVFDADGGFARSVSVHPSGQGAGERLHSIRRLAPNRWVGRGVESVRPGPPGMVVRDTIAVGLLDDEVTDFELLERVAGRMTTATVVRGRPLTHVPSFTPEVTTTTWGRCVFVSNGDSPRVSVYDADGDRVVEFTGPGTLRAVTSEHVAARLAEQVAAIPDADPAMWERILEDEARPTALPFYHRIMADGWGRIWLQEYAAPSGVGSRFHVVSQDGRLLARLDAPVPMRTLSIGEWGVIARTIGELGVEVVEVRPFVDGPGPVADPLPECMDQ